MKKGIDVSEHNGVLDWVSIKASGISFAMIRASWGHFVEDAQLRRNVEQCVRVGMPYGLYHYSYASNDEEARSEATSFLQLSKQFNNRSYPLNLDMEDADGWKARNQVSDAQNLRTIQIFKDIIEGSQEYLTLYMSKSWFDRLRPLNRTLIDSLDAWLAHWGIASPSMDCGMWQYSSDGVVQGSSKRTDMNIAYKDYPSILSSMNQSQSPAIPEAPKEKEKYWKGMPLTCTGVWTSSTGGEWYPKEKLLYREGPYVIDEVFPGTIHPYRVIKGNTMIGYTNDLSIDSETTPAI